MLQQLAYDNNIHFFPFLKKLVLLYIPFLSRGRHRTTNTTTFHQKKRSRAHMQLMLHQKNQVIAGVEGGGEYKVVQYLKSLLDFSAQTGVGWVEGP